MINYKNKKFKIILRDALAVLTILGMVLFLFSRQAPPTSAAPALSDVISGLETSDTSTFTLNKPANVESGDVLIFHAQAGGNSTTLDPPPGWTEVYEIHANGAQETQSFAYRVVTDAASEPASYTYTSADARQWGGAIARLSGVDTTNPIDTFGTATGSGTTPTAPSIATTVDDTLLIAVAGGDGDLASFTAPSGYSEHWDEANTAAGGAALSGASRIQASAGSSGSAAFSSSFAEDWAAAHVAFAPAPVNRVQYKVGAQGTTSSATFDTEPVEGNLLVVMSAHRQEGDTPSISGSGWNLAINNCSYTSSCPDGSSSSHRRALAVWWKIAGPSEPTTISTSWSSSSNNQIIIQEFEHIEGGNFVFDSSASANSGDSSVTSQTTGTAGSSDGQDTLRVTAMMARGDTGAASWTNSIADNIYFFSSDSGSSITTQSAFGVSTAGKESTGSWPTAQDSTAGILVFSLASASSPDLASQNLSTNGTLVEGESISFQGDIFNQGGVDAGSSVSRFRLDIGDDGSYDTTLGTPSTGSLASLESEAETSGSWTAQAGTHRFELCADINNDVSEGDEGNNCSTSQFTVVPAGTIIKVQEADNSCSSCTSLSATLASEPSAGNVLIAGLFARGDEPNDISTSGWTRIEENIDTSNADTLELWYRIADGSEGSNYTVNTSLTSNAGDSILWVSEWAGFTNAAFDVSAQEPVSDSTQKSSGTTSTTTEADSWAIAVFSTRGGSIRTTGFSQSFSETYDQGAGSSNLHAAVKTLSTTGQQETTATFDTSARAMGAIGVFSIDTTPETLSVDISALPSASGTDPHDVTLRGDVTGTATGSINYSFWWDCADTTTSVTTAEAACGALPSSGTCNAVGCKYDGTSNDPQDTSVHQYTTGTYTGKVIAERGGAPAAEARVVIDVSASPAPTVDLQGHGEVSSTFNDGPISISSGDDVTLEWSSTDADDCTASGGWSGTKATSGTETITGVTTDTTFSLYCSNASGDSPTDNFEARILTVSLTADPSSGTDPLNGVDLTASVGGDVGGGATYHYMFDCTNDGTPEVDVTNTSNPYTATDACNYSPDGTYTPSVTVEHWEGAATDTDTVTVSIAATVPDLSAPTHGNVTINSADMGATIDSDGGASIAERGTCWGTSSNPTTNCAPEGGTATGAFSHNRTGLPSDTTIYYRGYADNSEGRGYSPEGSFNTPAETLSVSILSNGSNPDSGTAPYDATLSGDVGGTATGSINYSFWWDCSDPTTSVATAQSSCGSLPPSGSCDAVGCKYDGTSNDPQNTSVHTYSAGTYIGKVIVERGGASPAEARVDIDVNGAPYLVSPYNPSDGPVVETAEVGIDVYWQDPNGDSVYAIACQTDEVTAGTPPSCPGGTWAGPSPISGTSPINLFYTTNSSDAGTNNYYVFVCDDSAACSSVDEANDGSFDVYEFPTGGFSITSQIEAEDYSAFNDSDAGNTGGVYRNDDVDIEENTDPLEPDNNGRNVGWTEAGEWLEYDVDIPSNGNYTFELRVAQNSGADRTMHIEVDNQGGAPGFTDVTGPITIPDTGGWDNWTTVSVPGVFLEASPHIVRVVFDDGFVNFNWFVSVAEANSTPTLQSFSDSPDPVFEGASITFSVDWADTDPGENVRVHICKTNSATGDGSGGSCDGGSWVSSSLTSSDPIDLFYTTQSGDVATSPNDYYVFICDDGSACSSASGNSDDFTVNPSSGIDWGISFNGNTEEFEGWAWGDEVVGWASFHSTTDGSTEAYSVKSTPFNAAPGILGANVLFSPSSGPTCTSQMRFSWSFSDPEDGDSCDDPNSLCGYRLQVSDTSGLWLQDNLQFDSGVVRSGAEERFVTIASPATNEFDDNVADGDGTLAFNSTYYWRVQVYDSDGEPSDWFVYQDNLSPADPFQTSLHPYPEPDFDWSCTDTSDPENPNEDCSVSARIQFNDLTTFYGGNSSWEWSFPDEFACYNPLNGCETVQNPRIQVTEAGDYAVRLIATDGDLAADPNSGNGECSFTQLVTGQFPLPDRFEEVTPVSLFDRIKAFFSPIFSWEFTKNLLAIN